ncbi:MAG TPA: hypothetical protein VH188_06145 [Chthoniobacterales bacterium]|nr:hypothetical protein [Chthoniobacterales bacterium]
MTTPDSAPLWKEVLGDAEPRRRGREAIIVVSIVILLGEALSVIAKLMSGNPRDFFLQIVIAWSVALLLYFVWIGQSWARWILAPVFFIDGCWDIVWGIIGSNGLWVVIGIGELIIFTYLAISPSVYVFARHQRERIRRWEVLAISGIFLLVLLSLSSGILAFFIYQHRLQAEGTEFARMTFHRVFENRDPNYLADHSSRRRKFSSPQDLIDQINSELGEIQKVGPLGTSFRTKFVLDHLEIQGTARLRVVFQEAPVWVTISISRKDEDWEIDHISWNY